MAPPIFIAALCRRVPSREQARVFRHLRPFRDTHRHRMPTRVAESINALMARGQLSIVAGRMAACAREGSRVAVSVRRRSGDTARFDVDAVVNARDRGGLLACERSAG